MNLEQELVVNGGVPVGVAYAMACLPDLQVLMTNRLRPVDLPPNALVVVSYGRLVEVFDVPTRDREGYRRMFVNSFEGGTSFLCSQLAGLLRTHNEAVRIIVSSEQWRKSSVMSEFALGLAIKHGARMSHKVAGFGFATCRERLEYLQQYTGLNLKHWSKNDIAKWSGMSREMVSRMVHNGELDAPTAEA